MIWLRYANVELLRNWLQHWAVMVFLGWTMDLGTRVGVEFPRLGSVDLWEPWVFIALLLVPLSLFTGTYSILKKWERENTLSLLQYTGMGFGKVWIPFVMFFLVPFLIWIFLREGVFPQLQAMKEREVSQEIPIVLVEKEVRWTLFPNRDLKSGQALLEVEDGKTLRHYQSWSWGRRGVNLHVGKNLSQAKKLRDDQKSLRQLCPSFEHFLILRGLGGDLPLVTLWEYRHLNEASLELMKRGFQPIVIFFFLAWHWRGALLRKPKNLSLSMARSALIFGFSMLALENLL